MDYSASAWARDPGTLYRTLNGFAMRKVAQFNERQRSIPVLERQALAIHLFATKLNSSDLEGIYRREVANIQALRQDAEQLKSLVHDLLQKLLSVRSWVQEHIPGGQFLGGPEAFAVPAAVVAISATAVYVVSRIDRFIQRHDGSVKNVQEALAAIDRMSITPEKKRELKDYVVKNGGLPEKNALSGLVGAFSGGLVIAALAIVFLLNRKRRAA